MRRAIGMTLACALFVTGEPATAQPKLPYWASISAGKARMRTGPGRQFPASWLYQRAGLPVKVVETYPNWRKIVDPDGTTGWMQGNLIDEQRTALVIGKVRMLRSRPEPGAPVIWRAQGGVVGKISQCGDGWCLFDVKGRVGFIRTDALWGVEANERLP